MTANLGRLALAALVLVLVAGCSSTPKTFPYRSAYYLYVAPKDVVPTEYGEDRIRDAFKDALLTGEAGKPVILFVHGRGIEPHKSLVKGSAVEGRAVHRLRDEYKQPVVMFSWDSAYGWSAWDRCRPKAKAKLEAERLWIVMEELSKWPTSEGRPKIVLLVQSMGTVVLQNYLSTREIPKGLFENIVLSSADADNEGHHVWVEKLKQSGAPVFITVNPSDDTLFWSWSCRRWNRYPLGRKPGEPRVDGVGYEPFDTGAHQLFIPSNDFFRTVLSGGTWPKRAAPP